MIPLCQILLSRRDDDYLKNFDIDPRGSIRKFGRLLVPNDMELRKEILDDSHRSKFSIHPGSSKMYADMK